MKSVARFRLAVVMFATLLGLTIPALAQPPAAVQPPTPVFCQYKNAQGMCTVPVTFVNNYPGQKPVFLFIKGVVGTPPNDVTYYVSNANGDVTITPALGSDPITKMPIYKSLPDGGLKLDAENQVVMLPKLQGLRFYVSLDKPLKTCCNNNKQGGPVSEPNGWTPPADNAPQGDKDNYKTIFDFLELTWPANDHFGANTTQVEMFGLPMLLELTGKSLATGETVTLPAGFTQDFKTLMSDYIKLGKPWTYLVLEPDSEVSRIISPYHGLKLRQNPFPAALMEKYITAVFTYYKYQSGANTLQSNVCEKKWTGNTFMGQTGNPFRFRVDNAGAWQFEILQPTAQMTYENQLEKNIRYLVNQPAEPVTCAAHQVARDLGAQLIRTTLLRDTHLYQGDCPASFVKKFYTADSIQQYAKFWHVKGIKNLAYSFGYDDTCNQSSIVIVNQPTKLKITVGGVKPPVGPGGN